MQDAYNVLKTYFGYDSFRTGQESLIRAVLSGRDALGIMPTGAGKSLCYQIPALIFPGLTLVVTPLISLMEDQTGALQGRRIPARFINSAMPRSEREEVLTLAAKGALRLLYVSPERLASPRFLSFAENADISLLVVDEAHCISHWGREFRPSYRRIGDFAARLKARPVILALTATATREVKEDIIGNLGLRDPFCLTTGFDRPNLFFTVQHPADKWQALLGFLHKYKGSCGIVYCMTRRTVDALAKRLSFRGIACRPYHAGLPEKVRRENQEDWLAGRVLLMVATNAFGMGIDKQNVGFVVHYNMPKNMESYYQEAGRAGRDGSRAECLLLYGPGDVHTAEFLIRTSLEGLEPETARRRETMEMEKLEQMKRYCFTPGCLRHYILGYFGEDSPERCGTCGNCMARQNIFAALRAGPRRKTGEKSLYELLRSIRKDYADRSSLPPELIFSDRTLQAMASEKPQNEHDMLQIPGVSPVKYQMYGKVFLKAIQRNSHRRSGLE